MPSTCSSKNKYKPATPAIRPVAFIPACPVCQEKMWPVPGQKSGAWRCKNKSCRNLGGEYWDALDKKDYKRPKLPEFPQLNQDSPDQLTLINQHQDFNPTCPRHVTIPMLFMPDESWTCPECLGQYYPEGAPDNVIGMIKDKITSVATKKLMLPGESNWDNMSAKHKSHGNSKGRSRSKGRVSSGFDARYGGIESGINSFNNNGGKKGA